MVVIFHIYQLQNLMTKLNAFEPSIQEKIFVDWVCVNGVLISPVDLVKRVILSEFVDIGITTVVVNKLKILSKVHFPIQQLYSDIMLW